MQSCTEYSAVFKWVQHTPVGWLRSLPEEQLEEVRETLVTEVREAGRALYWVDGILRVRSQKQQPRGEPPLDESQWGGLK